MWIWTVLTSEFFWGVIVGLVLSVFGSYWLAKFSASETRKTQKELVKNFSADTVSNLKKVVDGMSDLRNKTKLIHPDYLMLIDVEVNVFGRNREHIIALPEQLRDKVRNFVTDCALRRAEVGNYLATFDSNLKLANELQIAMQGPQSDAARRTSETALASAHAAVDQLCIRTQEAAKLIDEIKASK